MLNHPCLSQLEKAIDMKQTCGYITMLRTGAPPTAHRKPRPHRKQGPHLQSPTAAEKQKQHEISEFLHDLQELGIGEPKPEAFPDGQSEPTLALSYSQSVEYSWTVGRNSHTVSLVQLSLRIVPVV